MNIKPMILDRERIDVSEWDPEIVAYIREMNSFEMLSFNDKFLVWFSRDKTPEERFNAAFDAALESLVDGDGNRLLKEEDRDALSKASFAPFSRMFLARMNSTKVESTKKN